MKRKRLSKKKKGEIAAKLLEKLPQPTEEEMRIIARKTNVSVTQIRAAVGT